MKRWCMAGLSVLVLAARAGAQLLATDDFQDYTGNPIGQVGGSGDWVGVWAVGSQADGGTFLSPDSKIDGTRSLGLYGQAGTSGESVNRPFAACTNELTVAWSMRADLNVNNAGGAPVGLRRMAVTLRSGNGASHFDGQRLAFFFAAGTTNFMWYDGVDRTNAVVNFTLGHVYDLRVTMNPTNRAYSFVASNRNNGTAFSYSGSWTLGANGDSIGSLSFLMRGPNVSGNDAFLDSVSVSSPSYVPPPLPGLPIREGDTWRYFKGTSMPAVQGTNQWYDLAYNDLAWGGPSPSGFGFGDCDDATVLGDMRSNYWAIFTRTAFLVSDTSAISALTLAADFDDGLVAYLNGTEVARLNVSNGPVLNVTGAAGNHEASRGESASTPQEKTYLALDPGLLRNGTNVLAVSGHNVSLSSSDFSLIAELYANAALVRGPFVQMPGTGATAAIAWRTAAPADSVVDYGLDLSYSAGSVTNGALTRDHTVHLAGLAPGTTYYYRVRSGGEVLSAAQSFRTRPAPNQAFRFVVIGDHGQGLPQMYTIASLINARTDFDAILTVGDNVYGDLACTLDGAPGWYDPFWFELYAPTMARVATFPALGNHDWDTASGQYMVDYFRLPANGPAGYIGKNYSFDFGNIHFAVIDTEPYEDNNTTAMNAIDAWLTADLSATTQRWRMVTLHRPPYTSVGGHDDNARVKARIVPILKSGGVHVVFQGHNHWYERINPINGTHYLTTGGAGSGLYTPSPRKEYSRVMYNSRHSYTVCDVQGGRLSVQQVNDLGAVVDQFELSLDHPFLMDGLLETGARVLASNTLNTIRLHGAIRGNHLYVAGQDAPPPANGNNDHFIFVNTNLTDASVPAPWAKAGSNVPWSVFLGDESTDGFVGWFGPDQQILTNPQTYRAVSSGLFQNGTNLNGVMEGTLDLPGHFGSFPPELCLAFAPYSTTNQGVLLSDYQIPPAGPGDNINSSEWVRVSTRDLALDLPVAEAGSSTTAEAGVWVALDGSGSSAPSGLPLSHAWSQMDGPAGVFSNAAASQAAFRLADQVAAATAVVLRLTVNDTRFDSNDTVQVTFVPMVDSDGDGLSDGEEQTGVNNAFTPANPGGVTSSYQNADSDGDGMWDGAEAIAGTDRNNPSSLLQVVETGAQPDGAHVVVRWSGVTGRLYAVRRATNLVEAFAPVISNVPGSAPFSAYTATVDNAERAFFSIEAQQ